MQNSFYPAQSFGYSETFFLELGGRFDGLHVAYHTFGNLHPDKDNVVWICHALTADSDVSGWWKGMVGPGTLYDPSEYFIVCANYLGSCYGTTGPLTINPTTGKPWYREFPDITVRDMVRVHELLRQHLGIGHIHTVIGGSIGGFQSMEWAIANPGLFTHAVLIACNEKSTPWTIALNESQRLSILADRTFFDDIPEGGAAGLKAARSVALLSYRNGVAYNKTQGEEAIEKTGDFRASSYQRYQGDKLTRRFNAYSYFSITKTMDTHNVARGRGNTAGALKRIKARTLVVGITTDILFPVNEQQQMATAIPGAQYREIQSDFGHDGFLVEPAALTEVILNFYKKKK
ncbi:MAG: homoserine O-acetyltransferase [Bacteroidota bacterium]